ncbi:hypothetical protein DVH24_014721 [Malus domestica]|uniref:Uncharacterized protein n=1 Tax=Malus domestica TaxID=3750 RepID=A0A498K7N9_MALDO|nr:hypothetical protein DVH24_014721 [Malus domestica]
MRELYYLVFYKDRKRCSVLVDFGVSLPAKSLRLRNKLHSVSCSEFKLPKKPPNQTRQLQMESMAMASDPDSSFFRVLLSTLIPNLAGDTKTPPGFLFI